MFSGIINIIFNDDYKMTLLFKRSVAKKFFPGVWAPVAAGPYPEGTDLETKSKDELIEESGLKNFRLVKKIPPTTARVGDTDMIITVFIYTTSLTEDVVLNDEHTAYKWVSLEDLGSEDYDPMLSNLILNASHYDQKNT